MLDIEDMLPLSLVFDLWVKVASRTYAGDGVNVPLMVMPGRFIARVLRQYGATIGEGVRFNAPLTIRNSSSRPRRYYENLSVGHHCYLGRGLFFDLKEKIQIGDGVTISHRVTIVTHTDVYASALKDSYVPSSRASVTGMGPMSGRMPRYFREQKSDIAPSSGQGRWLRERFHRFAWPQVSQPE